MNPMQRIRFFSTRIVNLFRRSTLESDLTEQLEVHRQMIKDDELRAGRVGDRVLVPREELGAGPSLIRGCGVYYDLGWPDGHF